MKTKFSLNTFFYRLDDILNLLYPVEKLKNTIENNDWHNEQSVYEHTIKVYKAIPLLINLEHPLCKKLIPLKVSIITYFNQKIDNSYSRNELLRFSSIFHDLGKPSKLKKDKNGNTSVSDHAIEGLKITESILNNFDLTKKQTNYVISIIRKHHDPDTVIESIGKQSFYLNLNDFYKRNNDIFIDLLFFYLADFEGCDAKPVISDMKQNIFTLLCDLIEKYFKKEI